MPLVRKFTVKTKLPAAMGGLVLVAAASVAHAEPVTLFGYILNASVGGQYAPSYEGSKSYAWFPTGSLAVARPWEFDAFSAPDDAASIALLNTKRFQFGGALSVRENRDNDGVLEGMRSIGWALQGGGFMNVWPTHFMRIHVEGLKGATSESGIVVNSGIDFVAHPNKWNLSIGPRYSWGDARFNGTYFGVNRAEAIASPYIVNPFHAGSGSHTAGIETMAEYKLFPRWRLTFNAGYSRVIGNDANSPIVRQLGSVDQYSVGTGIRFMLQD